MMMRSRDHGVMKAQAVAEKAVAAVGCGYDLANDLRLNRVKSSGRVIEVDGGSVHHDLVLPGGVVVSGVPAAIVADKGERTRFRSDVVSFSQMSEQFNQSMSLTGKIPSGMFNAMFYFPGCWHKDAAATKCLCFDGWFIELYSVEVARSQLVLQERIKQDVPTSWDPAALAEFIEKYGTHVIVGIKIGGKDVVYLKQSQSSIVQQNGLQNLLKKLADEKFSEDDAENGMPAYSELPKGLNGNMDLSSVALKSFRPTVVSHSHKDDIVSIHVRRGGLDTGQNHNSWLSTINQYPNVISMSFVPITSLLIGVRGCGFLNHAVNVYLRYKPPIEELQQFLEFELPRKWAPQFGELAIGPQRKNSLPSLQFSIMGPKLHVNTVQVDSGKHPVTGIRLYLEGSRNDQLAVHLQHLSALPRTLRILDDVSSSNNTVLSERAYFEPVNSALLSHISTAPVQYNGARIDEPAAIVTKAWLEVRESCMKKVLFLRLGFSSVAAMKIRRSEWDGPSSVTRKSGSISALISARFSSGQISTFTTNPKVEVNSAVYPKGPPVPLRVQKMSRFVDTTDMVRGPDDLPGYWVVTGAKLCVEGRKIALKVKYSLLVAMLEDSDL